MSQWIAIGVTLFFALAAVIKAYGYDRRRMEDMEKQVDKSFKYHAEHFQHAKDDEKHFRDTEVHWTPRERDALNKRMDRQDEKLDAIHEDIRSLTERMYGK